MSAFYNDFIEKSLTNPCLKGWSPRQKYCRPWSGEKGGR